MDSSSSTSSSSQDAQRQGARSWALVATLLVTLGIGVVVGLASRRIAGAAVLMFDLKRARAQAGPPLDVMLLGDSTAVAAVQAREIERALPAGVRVYNFGLPASGPSGAEVLLRLHLESHPAPRLVLLGFSPWMLLDRRDLFEGFVLPSLFGPGDAARATLRDARPGYLLHWVVGRWPTLRHRDDLRSASFSLLLQLSPRAEPLLRGWLGYRDDPVGVHAFRWHYMQRSRRNQALAAQLEQDRGWHYWRDAAMPGERLPDAYAFRDPEFRASPRETQALEAVLSLCRAAGSPVLALPMPQPEGRMQAMARRGDAARFEAFWQDIARRHPELTLASQRLTPAPHAWFADNAHVHPEGARLYTQALLPLVTAMYGSVAGAR